MRCVSASACPCVTLSVTHSYHARGQQLSLGYPGQRLGILCMNPVLSAIHTHILATSVQLARHVEAHVHEARSSLYLPVDLSHA
jgi:hypothetical protein